MNTTVLHPEVPAPGHPMAVCVHGLGRDSLASFYWTLAIPLTRLGFAVALYDLRGHGASTRPQDGYRLDDFSTELGGVVAHLTAEYGDTGPLLLVGNSYGGAVALHFAYQRPERVAGVAVLESGPPTELWSRSMRLTIDGVRRALQAPQTLQALRERLGPVAVEESLRMAEEFAATTLYADAPTGTLLSEYEVARYPHPVLALFGGASPAAGAAPLLRRTMPSCRVEVLAGQGHTMLVDAPGSVRRLVLPWLADRASEAARGR
ncbi:alpha/beta fold hydrolase [Actinoalloteichus hymeniacidonis]|uniref:alpha/beta fold hydrolase n=1 Tax=Actinoalloteichus hymeniacidonis TaxID=340345 RepID=UPI001618E0DD|nr:alpha/beta hydrolase [Actinoalloteichus hymeniacidonis]MBB5907697.1 pimeloyl-ACP methyl ester carboxylesterase [Actinoalloteichus hymeniacidonis]